MPVPVALEALDLAHRWQVDHTVSALEVALSQGLEDRLAGQLPEEQVRFLNQLLEAAVMKQLRQLRSACHQVVRSNSHLRQAAADGAFGRVATQDLLQCIAGLGQGKCVSKRR